MHAAHARHTLTPLGMQSGIAKSHGSNVSCGIHISVSEARLIYEAMKNWEDHTCIRFKKRTNEVIYINYFPGSG